MNSTINQSQDDKVIEVNQRITQTMRKYVKSASLFSSVKSEEEFLDYIKQDNIKVEYNSKSGSVGSKPMSLKNEKSNLKCEENGSIPMSLKNEKSNLKCEENGRFDDQFSAAVTGGGENHISPD